MKRDTSVEDIEMELLLEGIFQLFGVDYRDYKRAPLKRKLHQLMHAMGATTISALQNKVMHDSETRDALLRALCARPESKISDHEYWKSLRVVLGSYLSSFPSPRIWIAECADTYEADMLSMLLEEERLGAHAQIFVTSSNEALVREARKGGRGERISGKHAEPRACVGDIGSSNRHLLAADNRMAFRPTAQDHITWSQFNLATDGTFNEFQLIICRSALSDCGVFLKRRALNLFHESLSTFGILNVDDVSEIETAPFSTQFKKLPLTEGWYKRIS